MPSLTLFTPPEDLVEEMLESVCAHLRRYADLGASPAIEPPDMSYIRELVRAAVAIVDGPAGRIGRCLMTQSWKLLADGFVPDIVLPLPPAQSITSIRYIDDDGTWQTLPPDQYRLTGVGSWAAELCPTFGSSWPSTRDQRECVEIIFVTGYGDEIGAVPAPILQAIRLLVSHWYLERQPVTFTTPHEIPFGVNGILSPFRVYR
jgi:uncharacterized phiE125 gp8 family phage protein